MLNISRLWKCTQSLQERNYNFRSLCLLLQRREVGLDTGSKSE
jgi:hypothetical protein